jgi:hypothetical protein
MLWLGLLAAVHVDTYERRKFALLAARRDMKVEECKPFPPSRRRSRRE